MIRFLVWESSCVGFFGEYMIIRHVDPSSYGWGFDAAGPVENASFRVLRLGGVG